MVIFRTPDGKPGYQPAETIDEAVEVVERLRNDDGVDNVRIFRLDEVIFEYKPYYKVEIAGAGAPEAPSVESSESTSDESDRDSAFDSMTADADSIETSGSDSDESESRPTWDAPPPPPPAGVFGQHHASSVDDAELSDSGTARRGLFGR